VDSLVCSCPADNLGETNDSQQKGGCLCCISNFASSGQSASPSLRPQACFPWLPWHDLESCHVQAGAILVQPAGGLMGCNKPPAGGQPVPLYYSNPDIVYANEFPAPCFEQGRSCLAAALDAVYAAERMHVDSRTAPMLIYWVCVILLLHLHLKTSIFVTSLSCSSDNACNSACSLMSAFGYDTVFSLVGMFGPVLNRLSAAICISPGSFLRR